MKQIIADSMVVIHFAKITLLETLSDCFEVMVPKKVYEESVANQKKFPDAVIISELIEKGKIKVIKASKTVVKEMERFGIMKGEAEAVAAFKEGKGELLASDDDVVSRNSAILDLKLVGTPALLVWLFEKRKVSKEKVIRSLTELKRLAWFESGLIDRIIAEVEKHD
ncbi:MAG: hypothetical protein ACE5KJ_08815 [Candidatus Zixiibacteriota bacterium]